MCRPPGLQLETRDTTRVVVGPERVVAEPELLVPSEVAGGKRYSRRSEHVGYSGLGVWLVVGPVSSLRFSCDMQLIRFHLLNFKLNLS